MAGYVKVSGTWTKTAPWVKSSGTWAKAKEAYANVSGTWKQWWLDGGVNDTTFTIGTGLNLYAWAMAIQSDGKIVLGGQFATFNGATVNGIVRLNSDGTRDTAFTANTGSGITTNTVVNAIAIQSDGKIVLGGSFTTFNGATANRIVRLNSDGTRDTAFTTNTGTGFDQLSASIAIQSDGKIIIGGYYSTFNGVTVNGIVRLNSDGTRDTAFTANTGAGMDWQGYGARYTRQIAIQSDGKIIIVGFFTTFNGATVNCIVRLNSDGTRDTAFTTNTGSGSTVGGETSGVSIQSDGKIIIVGIFTTFNGATANRIVRLNSDGTRDTAFTTNTGTGFDSGSWTTVIQSDGKIVIGGDFTTFNGATVNRIVRLNSDGTRDTAFTTNTGTGFDDMPYAIVIQSDGKIIIGGDFDTFNGVSKSQLARIGGE